MPVPLPSPTVSNLEPPDADEARATAGGVTTAIAPAAAVRAGGRSRR